MKNSKRWLALIVVAVLAVSILPVASFAAGNKAERIAKGIFDAAGKVAAAVKDGQELVPDCEGTEKTPEGIKDAILNVAQKVIPGVNEKTNLLNDGLTVNAIGDALNNGIATGIDNWFNDGIVGGKDNNVNDGLVYGRDNNHNDGLTIGAHNQFNDGITIGCNNVGNDGITIDFCHFAPTAVDEVPATCTENGMKAHYVCPKCGDLFVKCETSSGCPYYKNVTEEELIIPALGHDWAAPTYTWNADHTECTAARKCNRCGLVESETVKAVITEKGGVKTYTADFEADWAETQTYTEKVSNPTVPSTGDDSNTVLYVAMAGVAAALVGALMVVSKKKVR